MSLQPLVKQSEEICLKRLHALQKQRDDVTEFYTFLLYAHMHPKKEVPRNTQKLISSLAVRHLRRVMQLVVEQLLDLKKCTTPRVGKTATKHQQQAVEKFAYRVIEEGNALVTNHYRLNDDLLLRASSLWHSSEYQPVRHTLATQNAFFRAMEERVQSHIRIAFRSPRTATVSVYRLLHLTDAQIRDIRRFVVNGKGKWTDVTNELVENGVLDVANMAARIYVALLPAFRIHGLTRALQRVAMET